MTLYDEFDDQWRNTRRRKLANNTYLENRENHYAVRLHRTDILGAYPDGSISLNAGGWRTVTTKERLNRYLPAGFGLWQERGEWFGSRGRYDSAGFRRYAFADGMRISADGTVTGAAIARSAKENRALLKTLGDFADTYLDRLASGELPKPSGGDCWGCHMRATDGSYPMGRDCIASHVAESYYVPSLIVRALDEFPSAQVAQDMLHAFWMEPNGKRAEIYRAGGPFSLRANGGTGRGMGADFLRRPLLRLLKRGHGLAS